MGHTEQTKRLISERTRGRRAWNKGVLKTREYIQDNIEHIREEYQYIKLQLLAKKYHMNTQSFRKILIDNGVTIRCRGAMHGNRNVNWENGISQEAYSVDWTQTLKRSIRERDHYTCQECFKEGNIVHHKDRNKKNCNPTNLVTVCRKCHRAIHNILRGK